MLRIEYAKSFKKDLKTIQKRQYDMRKLDETIHLLASEQELPARYRDHALTGKYAEFRECHILPDWLLIYKVERGTLTLALSRTGTHSDLF